MFPRISRRALTWVLAPAAALLLPALLPAAPAGAARTPPWTPPPVTPAL
ncbi:hypothetical protein SMICM17S_04537 [Streptomyces microflavus]